MANPVPLKPVDFHLLLALVDEPLHGYALAARIREQSDGQVRMMPGNLYSVIRRLVQQGLVAEAEAPAAAGSVDSRRRYFTLTDLGRRVLEEEARRMARMAELARRRLLGEGDGEVAS